MTESLAIHARRPVQLVGWWYHLVLIGTAGLFAWIPFLHAAIRLRTIGARKLAALFAALDALMYTVIMLAPEDSSGQVTNGPISLVFALLVLSTVLAGSMALNPLRRMAYGLPRAGKPRSTADPAVRAVLTARARRDEARKLAAHDPLLAHELRIGRPDLTGTYDDGGLVDLNSAPTEVIAEICAIPPDLAETIVTARTDRPQPFTNVDELFITIDLPISTWDRIRDRAILMP